MISPTNGRPVSTTEASRAVIRSPEHHRDDLLRIARLRIGPGAQGRLEASDVVQQTLATAVEKFDQFRGGTDAEMAGWLRAILNNHLAALMRRSATNPSGRARSLEAGPDRSSDRAPDALAATDTSPSEAVARTEGADRLASALALLPEDQREAVRLRHLDGLPVAEVAARMGRSVAAVAGLLHRGTDRLRELLGDHP